MNEEEFSQLMSKIDKKLDKILNMQTKIAKALHLIPVTEKEERALQLQQRNNFAIQTKVSEDLDAMENKSENQNLFSIHNLIGDSLYDTYSDIIGTDYITEDKD